jgi:hypothetical protein
VWWIRIRSRIRNFLPDPDPESDPKQINSNTFDISDLLPRLHEAAICNVAECCGLVSRSPRWCRLLCEAASEATCMRFYLQTPSPPFNPMDCRADPFTPPPLVFFIVCSSIQIYIYRYTLSNIQNFRCRQSDVLSLQYDCDDAKQNRERCLGWGRVLVIEFWLYIQSLAQLEWTYSGTTFPNSSPY